MFKSILYTIFSIIGVIMFVFYLWALFTIKLFFWNYISFFIVIVVTIYYINKTVKNYKIILNNKRKKESKTKLEDDSTIGKNLSAKCQNCKYFKFFKKYHQQ